MSYPEKEYAGFLREGRFMLQKSASSGRFVFPPRAMEPATGAQDLEWTQVSGRGTVYSVSVVRRKPPTPDYNVCLIDLEEGVRMMSRVDIEDPSAVRIGMAVQARIDMVDDEPIVVFVPGDA